MMKKHVPFLLSLLSIMGLLAWTVVVHAQCSQEHELVNIPVNGNVDDQSPFQHSVTISGATYATGQNGDSNGAVSFNGTNDAVVVPYDPSFLSMSDAFTIAAWVNPTSLLSYNTIVSKLNGSHRDVVFRYHSDGKFQLHWTNSGGGISSITTDVAYVAVNGWQHLTATWDGTDMRLFINGVLVKETTFSEGPTIQTAGGIQIGRMNGSERTVGYLDNVQIRSYAVPNDEVACLMNAFVSPTNGVVLDLPLNGGSATDVSANANNGTATAVSGTIDRFNQSGGATHFNGQSSRISVPNISAYNNLDQGFTVSAWVFGGTAPNVTNTIVSKTATGRDIVLRLVNGVFSAHYYVNGYVWCTAPDPTFNGASWDHVACTWNGSSMIIYQNGEALQTIAPAVGPTFSSAPWNIGSLTASGGEYFEGEIDQVKVWDRALSSCELRAEMMPYIDLVSEDNLSMCTGQTLSVSASDMCTYLWTNDNSTEQSFVIDATALGAGDHQIVLEAYDRFDNLYTDTVNVTVSICTGIEEQSTLHTMKLFPNPATSVVTVSSDGLAEIQLLDVSGRVLKVQGSSGQTNTDLDISTFPSGVYFVKGIKNDGTQLSQRLMKH